jgi:hypothetical protein
MTDIKTALSQAMSDWETPKTEGEPNGKHLFKPTTNVTRATFEIVRANPGITRSAAYKLLDKQGYKLSSTASLMTAFVLQGQMEVVDGKVFTTSNEYVPLKTGKAAKAFRKTVATKAYAKVVEKMSPKPNPAKPKYSPIEAAPPRQERRVMDIEEWLNEVPLMQARLVYMRLKFIFEGENK